MYKYSNGQISLTNFKQPVGMHLKESNRWVKKAQIILGLILKSDMLGKINEMILKSVESEKHDDDDDHKDGGNSGTMIVDATCAPSHIRYPQDASLLNKARENTEKILDALHDPADGRKPRTYRQIVFRPFTISTASRKPCMTTTIIACQTAFSASVSLSSVPLYEGRPESQ